MSNVLCTRTRLYFVGIRLPTPGVDKSEAYGRCSLGLQVPMREHQHNSNVHAFHTSMSVGQGMKFAQKYERFMFARQKWWGTGVEFTNASFGSCRFVRIQT